MEGIRVHSGKRRIQNKFSDPKEKRFKLIFGALLGPSAKVKV